jgi:predicted PurR-regulated permease PerM
LRDAGASGVELETVHLTTPSDLSPEPHPVVPDWLAQSAGLGWRVLAVVAFGIVVLAGAAVLGTVVASVVLAAVVTAAFDPLAERLRASGRSPNAVAGLVTLTAIGLGVAAIAVIAIAFVPATADLLRALDAGLKQLQDALEAGQIPSSAASLVTEVVDGVTAWVSSTAVAVVSSLASTGTIVLLAVFLLFFLVNDADRAITWALQAAEPTQRERIAASGRVARRRLGRSLRETGLRAAVMGLVGLAVALVLGLPVPLALGVIVFVGGFIPLLGLVAATALVGLVALGSAGGLAAVAAVAVLAVVTAFLPRLLGQARWEGHGVHPALVLVALTVGALIAGWIGLILAVPVVIVLREVLPAIVAALNSGTAGVSSDGIVPRWLDRLAQWSWRLLVLVGIGAVALTGLQQVPLIVGPLVIAGVLAATLAPGVARLLRRGLSPTTSSLAMTVGGFGLALAILGVTLAALVGPMQEIAEEASLGAALVDAAVGSGTSLASVLETIGPQLINAIGVLVTALGVLVIAVVLGAILTFYLLRDGARGFDVATARLTPWRRDELAGAAGRATSVVGGYMIGTGAISAFGAATQFVIMWILGIPLAWPLAVLSFFGGFIPYIGSLLTTGLAFLVTVATGDVQDILIMGIFTLVFNIVQGNIVAPLVYGRAVSIHPAVVLLAIPAGAAVAGMAGMFLAVPVIGVVATTWRTVLRVLGSEPAEAADEGAATGSPVDLPAGAPAAIAADALDPAAT